MTRKARQPRPGHAGYLQVPEIVRWGLVRVVHDARGRSRAYLERETHMTMEEAYADAAAIASCACEGSLRRRHIREHGLYVVRTVMRTGQLVPRRNAKRSVA